MAVASHSPPLHHRKKTISSASQMACRAMILEQSTILCEAPFWTGAIGLEAKLDQTVETNGQTNRPWWLILMVVSWVKLDVESNTNPTMNTHWWHMLMKIFYEYSRIVERCWEFSGGWGLSFFSMTGFLVAATLVQSKWHLEVKSMASQWTMKEQCFEADVIRLSLFNVFF